MSSPVSGTELFWSKPTKMKKKSKRTSDIPRQNHRLVCHLFLLAFLVLVPANKKCAYMYFIWRRE